MSRMSPNEAFDEGGSDEQPKTMSLMSGVAGGSGAGGLSDADLMGVDAGRGKRLSQSSLVVIVVAVVAAGSLYLMRLTQGDLSAGGTAGDVEIKIEEALAKLTQPAALSADDPLQKKQLEALFSDTDTIVAMFAADLSAHQVPVEYVKKNPFHLAATEPMGPGVIPVDTTSRDHARRVAALQKQLDKLSLQTIMVSGNRNVAVIDGEFYQPGQSVGEFTIVSMDALTVRLTAGGETFQLTLNDNKRGG